MIKQLWLAIFFAICAIQAQAQLIITGVIDGPLSGGVPKAIELHAQADIADLSQYGLESANNGNDANAQEFTFPNVALNAGDTIYVASESNGFMTFFGFSPDYTSSAVSINGDDAILLYQNNAVIDVFGEVGMDGSGQSWEYTDGWAYRLTNSMPSTVFDPSQWVFSGTNALDNESANAGAETSFPANTFAGITTTPNPQPDPEQPNPEQPDPEQPEENIALVSISQVQGALDIAALEGQTVTVEAVVIGDFQNNDADESRNLGGFYLQEELADEDGNPDTSEGVFVLSNEAVELGQVVRVTGTVSEFFGTTQINAVSQVTIVNADDNLQRVKPANIDLASNTQVLVIDQDNLRFQPNLEAYENMLVNFVNELSIIEQFNLGRFNEIRLVAGDRPFQFTQKNTPNAALYQSSLRQLAARSIVYDDGLGNQNVGIDFLDGFAPYSESTAKRMGDKIANLSGVLSFAFNNWRVRAIQDGTNIFTSSAQGNSSNPRPLNPPSVNGNLKIASFNVLNFFTTLDDSSTTLSGLSPRGADTPQEFDRQKAKLVNAIISIDADVLGLLELENEFDPVNDGSNAIEVLVNEVNSQLGETVYSYVYPGRDLLGSDAIAVGFIYKIDVVAIAKGSQPAILNDAVAANFTVFSNRDFNADPIFDGVSTNRNSLAVTFNHLNTNDAFTAVVNHFKSKGGRGVAGNADAGDGAGNFNQRRLDAAIAVEQWLETNPTGIQDDDKVILGDLNAYAQEDPIQYLLAQGYNNVENDGAYSFVFDGQIGTLDYILLNDALFNKLNSTAVWHINADEASALDYNLDFNRSASYFDSTTPTRNSDHDPLYVGLDMQSTVQSTVLSISEIINVFNQHVENNTIQGNAQHRFIAQFKRYFYLRLLKQANSTFENGRTQLACHKLIITGKYSDGQPFPRDFIIGEGVSALVNQIHLFKKQQCEKVLPASFVSSF